LGCASLKVVSPVTTDKLPTREGPQPVRVLIADDQTLFRAGLVRLLEHDPRIRVVGQAVDGADAVQQAAALRPDLVLMDMRMPNLSGIEATGRIVAEHPEIKVVMLTTFEAESEVMQALRAGARGYVLKDSPTEAVVSSLLTVMAGEHVMAPTVANRIIDLVTGTTTAKALYDGLTPREIDILKLVAIGQANKQIAAKLRISEKTVRNHVSSMYTKLGIADRAQAVLYAVRKGLIEL
jgi:DNA-binding NarL/FixJ family response regulator